MDLLLSILRFEMNYEFVLKNIAEMNGEVVWGGGGESERRGNREVEIKRGGNILNQ